MKYSRNNSNSSSLRYFMAGLKPFGNLMFWLPLAILGLLSVVVWQYRSHPQWLNRVGEQPKTLEETIIENQNVKPMNPEVASSPLNGQPEQQNGTSTSPSTGDNQENLRRPFLRDQTETNAEQIQQPIETNLNRKPKSQLFQPWQTDNKSNLSSGGFSTIKPVQTAPVPGDNYLQKAMEKQAQNNSILNNSNGNSSTNSSDNLPNLNINNRSSFSNSQSYQSPEQIPANNNLTQQYQSGASYQPQPSTQPYQVPYNNNNYLPQPQQVQPPANSFQVPYNNYPTQPQNNNFAGQSNLNRQGNSVPANPYPYSQPSPKIQPAIR